MEIGCGLTTGGSDKADGYGDGRGDGFSFARGSATPFAFDFTQWLLFGG